MRFIRERVSYQPRCSFLCPCSRYKATRSILISVVLMACDADKFPKKQTEQHAKAYALAYALAPLRSCCTLLSHECGWAFAQACVWIDRSSGQSDFAPGGGSDDTSTQNVNEKCISLRYYGQGRLPIQYPKNPDQRIQFTTPLHELRWEPVQHYPNPFFI